MTDKKVRLQDIAEELGLSVSTVSRALRSDPRVALRTRRIVQVEAKRLNYPYVTLSKEEQNSESQPKTTTSIPGLKHLTIILRDNLQKHFFGETLLEIIDQGRRRNFSVDYEVYTGSIASRLKHVQSDAVLFILWENITGADALALQNHPTPVVVLNRYVDSLVNSITLDHSGWGVQAVRFLQQQGHEQIAYIPGIQSSWAYRERSKSFRAALEQFGCYREQYFTESVESNYFESVRQRVGNLMSLPEPPTAIVTYNDASAFISVVMARDLGFMVPEDLSVLGFDYAHDFRPYDLTTFDYRRNELGRCTIHLLEGIFRNTIQGPIQMSIAPKLCVGSTVDKVSATLSVDKVSS